MKCLILRAKCCKSKISETRLVAMDAILMSPSISALTHITVQVLATGRSVAMVRTYFFFK